MAKNINGTQINQSVTIVEKAGKAIADARNLIMKYDTDGNVVPASAGTDTLLGVAIIEAGYNDVSGVESGKVEAGDDVDIQIKDIGYILAGAEIKKGNEVTADKDGKAAVAAAGNHVIGVALSNANAGGYVRVQITKYVKGGATA